MGKVKWGTTASEVDEADEGEAFIPYDGPVPPSGSYRLALKRAEVKQFKSGNNGVELLFEIAEPKSSPKARYNGCPIWEYLVDVDTGTGKIKQFMQAIGGTGRHWAATMTAKDDRNREIVTKWGNIVADGLIVRGTTKRGKNNNDESRAELNRFLPKSDEADDDSDDFADADADATAAEDAPF
jgi:hypothetical protein